VIEGKAMRKANLEDDDIESMEDADLSPYDQEDDGEEGSDERYLGASTLAKLRDSKLFDEDEDE
jgi:hypothetical protein